MCYISSTSSEVKLKNAAQHQSRVTMNFKNAFKNILFIAVLILTSSKSFAYDADMAESSKCSRYFAMYENAFHMPSNLIKAVAITESGKYAKAAGRPVAWPWTVNAKGKGYHYANKREAIKAVNEFRAQGVKSIDVGCMQVNLMYHPEAFRNLEQAFEPKYNVGYAAKFLKDKYAQAGSWKEAVGLYHNGVTELNRGYIEQVYSAWRLEDKSVQVSSLEKPVISVSEAPRDAATDKDVSEITKSALGLFDRKVD